jgi:uncharacterized protein YajQ (UPF0234 family)
MPDNSFDVVSKIEMPEVHNAVQQALKEVQQRFASRTRTPPSSSMKDSKILLHQGRVQAQGRHRYPAIQLIKRQVR